MKNLGFKIIKSNGKDGYKSKQFIVVGVNRGGTSAIAKTLIALGVSFGDNCHEPIYEDTKLANAFRSGKWREFKRLIHFSENTFPLFGWKLPDSNKQLKRIHKYFSNPYYIFVYRDIFAISNRQSNVLELDLFNAMQSNIEAYERICKFNKREQPQSLHVSYEKLLLNKESYVKELATFCDISLDEALLEKAIKAIEPSPKKYTAWCDITSSIKSLNKEGFDGFIDNVSKRSISGWLLKRNSDTPVSVELFINDNPIGVYTCDIFREDLIQAGKSTTGVAGFNINYPDIQNGDIVTLKPKNSQAILSIVYEE